MAKLTGTSPVQVTVVWFDYTCPHSYIGLVKLEELASILGFEIDRRPFLVRLDSPDSIREGSVRGNVDKPNDNSPRRQPLYQPGEGTGTEPASNRSLSTLLVHSATAYAKEQGLDSQFFRAASEEYWQQGLDLGSIYSMRRIAVSVGLDWGEMWPKLESGSYRDLVLEQHDRATLAGVARAPSYRIRGKLYAGSMTFEQLRAAVQVDG